MFAVTVLFEIRSGQMEAFLPLMLENARTSKKKERGCQQFDVCKQGDTVFLYELYDDRAAFDTHLATDHFLSFDAAVGEMISSKTLATYDGVLR